MKAFHVSFSFTQQMPATITIPADTEDEAKDKLKTMAAGVSNLEIHEIIDIEKIPVYNKMLQESQAKEEASDVEPEKLN